eukprot:24473-Heterocapsa_arctica.AAC.1
MDAQTNHTFFNRKEVRTKSMLKAKPIHIHKREKANTNNARQGIIEEEASFKDKRDTDNNGNYFRHIEEKDRPTME